MAATVAAPSKNSRRFADIDPHGQFVYKTVFNWELGLSMILRGNSQQSLPRMYGHSISGSQDNVITFDVNRMQSFGASAVLRAKWTWR